MKITVTLNQDEMIKAIQQYVAESPIMSAAAGDIKVNLSGTRGGVGYSAVIDIDDSIEEVKATPKKVVEKKKVEPSKQPELPEPTPETKPKEVEAVKIVEPEPELEGAPIDDDALFGDTDAEEVTEDIIEEEPSDDNASEPEATEMSDEDADSLFN